ncbi:hypothetical protein RchiOBHm_Chr3g0458961 [Rosa chinensis]|uniref:Uncharacterized protein n=1 Tax=Rosa chinensis TaxID=74649 RepID=A0A2P6R812_ROSCH|nr:hypothetical protein RchiOBHm_Chr3g0458961 [Rosa chinensis]
MMQKGEMVGSLGSTIWIADVPRFGTCDPERGSLHKWAIPVTHGMTKYICNMFQLSNV